MTRAAQVKTLAEEIGIAFLGLGFQPKWSVADTPAMPKASLPVTALRAASDAPGTHFAQGRYKIMREYMPKVGTMGLDMMFRTCTVQVNLDFSSEEDMVKKFRVGLALQVRVTRLHAWPLVMTPGAAAANCNCALRQFAVRGRQAVRLCELPQQCVVRSLRLGARPARALSLPQDGRGQGTHGRLAVRVRAGLRL
jgi:hypothetical protein